MDANIQHRAAALVAIGLAAIASIANAAIPASERAALVALYASTHGEGWLDTTNWNGAPGTECSWFGITCDAAGAHVVGIALPDNSLAGPLPALDALTELTVLDVHTNDCERFELYCIPDPNANHINSQLQPLTNLRHLQHLYGRAAGFTGGIPSLSSFGALVTLDVGHNALTGPLPALEGLDTLEDFLVGENQLTGSIPPIALPNLRNFDVTAMQLTGSIPPLNHLANLETFKARGTTLTGSIPSLAGLAHLKIFDVALSTLDGTIGSLSGLSSLTSFDADYNNLTGSIPSLSGLTQLVTFDVHHNRLSGSIPPLAGLSALNTFNVWGNALTGALPSLAGLSNLYWFDAQLNQLTGTLPALTGLSNLWYFAVSFNEITGPIPALSNQGLDTLSQLVLDNNRLTGPIPALSGLSNLNYVTVRNNQLTGSLPALDASLTSFATLDASQNQLSGSIPDYSALPGEGYQLDVGSNALTGPIPPSIAKFGRFAASDNHLTGSIPDLFSAGTLTDFDVGFNDLSGSLPAPTPQMQTYGHASLCPNPLTPTPSAAWDTIAGHAPWYDGCAASYVDPNQFGLTGAWYDTNDPGKGFLIDAMPDHAGPGIGTFFGGWFNFLCGPGCPTGTPNNPEGQQQWFSFQDNVDATNPYVRQTVYESRGGSFDAPPTVGANPIGMFTIAFDDCSHGMLRYRIPRGPYPDRTVRLTRLTPSTRCTQDGTPVSIAPSSTLLSGAWYDPATSGQGLVFDINAENGMLFAAWYTFAINGADFDPIGTQRWYTLQARIPTDARTFDGVTIYSTTGGLFDAAYSSPGEGVTQTTPVGTASLRFESCSTLTVDYLFTGGEIAGASGTLHLSRLSPVPAGCN